jgi:hypothetical protein
MLDLGAGAGDEHRLPSRTSIAQRLLRPARLEEKTTVVPFARKSAPMIIAWSSVRRRGAPPAAGMTQTSSTSGATERTKASVGHREKRPARRRRAIRPAVW